MLPSRTRRLSLLTLVAAALATATLAPSASAAAQRFASPAGGGDCSAAFPCDITQAVAGAKADDEVIVNPGDYQVPTYVTITDPAQITIRGVAGQPRPRLFFSGGGRLRVQKGSTLRYVEVVSAAGETALATKNATVDQVIVRARGDVAGTAYVEISTIRNSIVVASAPNGRAITTVAYGAYNNSVLRNVTAIAAGSGGVAVEAHAHTGPGSNAFIAAWNVIARGGYGGASFQARTDNSDAQASIFLGYSNYGGGNLAKVGTKTSIQGGADNQAAAPVFVNAAEGDYRQAAGSPTIGAGVDDPKNGELDVDGDPRRIGTTDISADEFVLAPAATTGPAGGVGDRSAALSGSVDPNGAPTSYRFEYGPTTAYGSTTATIGAGSGRGPVAAAATLGGLSPATTYHYRIVATNSGGVTYGADQSFTTTGSTTPAPSPASTPQPAPGPGFAGVRLVSTRLSTTGRWITLRLSCPAATVGRCTGQTKLNARRRRSGSRAATTVSLGRRGSR
jgi:hypothetical protein